ncbi:hypothetical protein [Methanopyrus sp.]
MFWKVKFLGFITLCVALAAAGCQEVKAPPIDQPQRPPKVTGTGGQPAPAGPSGPGPGAPATPQPQTSYWQTFTSPLYSVQWATSEVPWFPVGLIAAIVIGYYVGYRKGPSP